MYVHHPAHDCTLPLYCIELHFRKVLCTRCTAGLHVGPSVRCADCTMLLHVDITGQMVTAAAAEPPAALRFTRSSQHSTAQHGRVLFVRACKDRGVVCQCATAACDGVTAYNKLRWLQAAELLQSAGSSSARSSRLVHGCVLHRGHQVRRPPAQQQRGAAAMCRAPGVRGTRGGARYGQQRRGSLMHTCLPWLLQKC
jgi:hypothetical protein